MNFLYNICGYPLGFIMWLIYQVIKNYAVAIVLFTLLTKLLMIPFSIKSQKSSARMASMQPKLAAIQKKYANNKEKMQEEQMKLYSAEGYNPMSGCLPMLITFPILFGVIDVVYRPLTHIFHYGKEFIAEAMIVTRQVCEAAAAAGAAIVPANQLANLERSYQAQLFVVQAFQYDPGAFSGLESMQSGFLSTMQTFTENFVLGPLNLGRNPDMTWPYILIPIMAVLSQLLVSVYSQLYQRKTNPTMKMNALMFVMMFGMPFFSGWISLSLPSAVGFYWAAQSVLSLVQMVVLNRIYTPERVAEMVKAEEAKRKKKGPTAFQRAMKESLEIQKQKEAAKAANGGKVLSARDEVLKESGLKPSEVDRKLTPEEKAEAEERRRISNKEAKDINRRIIAEARRRMAEKYGDEIDEIDDGEL